ncbi:MAG: toll/interleukin-1 receptor domain-containing protein [Ignavibacteriae bacterium]|nr:toll/interleukin-1 receptor domain-containing protein [Ignavibacteriota bacterium]
MPKAFLSHASKQKFYVEKVASILGQDKIIYDVFTFEEGNKTIDEIFIGLEQSDVFVLFISNEALESEWVKKEIFNAEILIKENQIKGFYPIIIDNTKHSDTRIPEWIKEYNLRNVSKPTKAAERILQKLRIVAWEMFPQTKAKQQLFIGRDKFKKEFDERIFNYDIPTPISIIVSGLPQVGRRRFLQHSLINANKIRDYYFPPTINMHSSASIEDFILFLFDLGYVASIDRKDLVDFLNIPMEEKIELAKIILLEIYASDNIVYVVDNFSIVYKDGQIVDWYIELIDRLSKEIRKIFILIISRVVPNYTSLKNKDYIYSISLPGLDKNECKNLFQAHLDIENLDISLVDKKNFSELFTGFPTQIIFTVDYLKKVGIDELRNNLHVIAEYNSEHISSTIREYKDNVAAMSLLRILAEYDIISLKLLRKIFETEEEINLRELIVEFSKRSIIEYVGAIKEYMKLNDGVRDYILRLNLRMEDKYIKSIKDYSLLILKDYTDKDDTDMSELSIAFQTAIKNGNINEIPKELLIPSYYLNAITDLYRNGLYDSAIDIADNLFQNKKNIDRRIISEIRYWLCSALAKNRDKRFTTEVQFIGQPDHNFLFGFYYRLTRRYDVALERLFSLLHEYPNYIKAKRELVLVYINLEDYDSAYELAKESYYQRKSNPYYIHAYFRCLIKQKNNISDQKKELKFLLDQLETIPSRKAHEMFYSLKSEYFAYIDHNEEMAYRIIDEGIKEFPENIYTYLTKMEISRYYYNTDVLTTVLDTINSNFKMSELEYRLNYLSAQVISHGLNKDFQAAEKFIRDKIKTKYSVKTVDGLENELNRLPK